MGTKSRDRLYGTSVRMAAERGAEARKEVDEKLDRLEKAMEVVPVLVETIQRMQELGASNDLSCEPINRNSVRDNALRAKGESSAAALAPSIRP